MLSPAVLARCAAFTDAFLSGLVIPLIPTILKTRAHVSHGQVQIWTSVLVSAHGGAFAVASPLIPLLARQSPLSYDVRHAGFTLSIGAFALLQFSDRLSLLILGRVLQGFAAAALTAGCSEILATTAGRNGSRCRLTRLTPTSIQSIAMATAPILAGFLHDYHSADAAFYLGYALLCLNVLLGVVVRIVRRDHQASSEDGPEALLGQTGGREYGTMQTGSSGPSGNASRPISPRTPFPAAPSQQYAPAALQAATAWSPRVLVALFGYLVVGLLTSALHSVLPLFVGRHFNWSVSASGYMFVPLSAPAALVGPLSGALAARMPKSARFLTSIGFLACLPAFLYLGELRGNNSITQHAFLLTLGGLSLGMGICGDPLVGEIANALSSSANDTPSAAAQAAILPSMANAWGSLAGPLLAGAVSWVWGWQTMNQSLALVAASAGVASLLFLQGWILSPGQDIRTLGRETGSDEESAPLLANDQSSRCSYRHSGDYAAKKEGCCAQRRDSDDVSQHTRNGGDRKSRRHRRHFSVDNFSVATTTTPGSMDSSTSSVRFQAALETPLHGVANGGTKRPPTNDAASKASGERRYVMREAPHAPATDPLLAAGSLYVVDEERDTSQGVESQRQKRRVVVFAEGTAPPELLERHRHHIVAINALDGTAQMVSDSTDSHAVHVTETEEEDPAVVEATSRRYVVVVVEGDEESV